MKEPIYYFCPRGCGSVEPDHVCPMGGFQPGETASPEPEKPAEPLGQEKQ